MAEGNDGGLRSSLIWLAVVMVMVGICTQSWKKIMVTYVVGILGIAGLLLPDWDFFDRDFSRWTCPVTAEERASILAQRQTSLLRRSVSQIFCFFLGSAFQFLSLVFAYEVLCTALLDCIGDQLYLLIDV